MTFVPSIFFGPDKSRRAWRPVAAYLVSTFLTAQTALASESCSTDAMIVFDGSASMSEMASQATHTPRIQEARLAIERAMPLIAPYRRVGLLTYGPGELRGMSGACTGIDLRFSPQKDAGTRILEEIQFLSPAGLTPLTEAVGRAAEVLNYQEKPGLIVLVTDGNETCGGSPCQLAAELSAVAHDLTVHVIGFHVRASKATHNDKVGDGATAAECLPALNGGSYVHTDSVEALAEALEGTLGCDAVSSLWTGRRRS